MYGGSVSARAVHLQVECVHAIALSLRPAIRALAAPWIGHHDVVAGLEGRNPVAYGAKDTGTLVAEHLRKLRGIVGIPSMQIGHTHAACDDFDEQFIITRVTQVELLDGERARALMHHGSGDFHDDASGIYSAASAVRATRAIASARYSGACAPDTANLPSKMKHGTPSMPASFAERASRSTSATSLSLASAVSISLASRPTSAAACARTLRFVRPAPAVK